MPEQTHTASTSRRDDFTLANVIPVLERAGVLDARMSARVRAEGDAHTAKLQAAIKTRAGDAPYVSPLEIIADFRFPSSHPRHDYLAISELSESWALAAGVPFARIDPLKLDTATLCDIVSRPFALRHLLAPIQLLDGTLRVVMVNPFDRNAAGQLEDVTGFHIEPVLGLRSEILKTINDIFAFGRTLHKAQRLRDPVFDLGNLEQLVDVMTDHELDASDQHIIRAVDLLLQYAFDQRASDIHVEPKRERALVRLRIDGRLHETHTIPLAVYPSFVSRIKIMARLDIAEKRRPQDGRIKSAYRDQEIELRVSSVPVAFGEKIVIRVFDPDILVQDIGQLGMTVEQRVVYERLVSRPHGIVLVTGPTGSGKTTTLYSTLQHICTPAINIVTIEDPIEMVHGPFNQIAVQESAGVTFSRALRSVLRQDPDVIMVGEIRDLETARYAVQAALTGHLVFSTLHTNTAVGSITRLVDLGIEPFLIASTVIGVIAQRLLRVVCSGCDEPYRPRDDELFLLGVGDANVDFSRVRHGTGCTRCRKTGYSGRIAAFEVVELNERLRAMVRDEDDERAIVKAARRMGSEPLLTSAVRKVLAGQTTAEEVLRVIPLTG